MGRTRRVLFLCTGNSARSVIAEVLVNSLAPDRFVAASAGSRPTGTINPGAVRVLKKRGHRLDGLRSKSWDEFSGSGADVVDIVITVCDRAAGESCPVWQGDPVTAHWGIADPAATSGSDDDIDAAFDATYRQLRNQIRRFLDLEIDALDRPQLQRAVQQIGTGT